MFHFFHKKKPVRYPPETADMQGLPVVPILLSDGSTSVRLTEAMEYYVLDFSFRVPRGFVSDGASIPAFFWRVIGHPFDMRYLRAAILHDWLYRAQIVPRAFADRALLVLLKYRPMMHRRRYLIYWALRAFGGIAWRKNTRRLANGVPLIDTASVPAEPTEPASAFIPKTRFQPGKKH